MNAAANDSTSPTTLDVYEIAKRLQVAYAQRCGVPVQNLSYVKAKIEASIPVADLARRLALGGLEMYSDCLGEPVIRTKEMGDAHRALVAAEKALDYLERNPEMAPYANLPKLD